MSGNSIGKRFMVSCFGESHGKCVGIVVDGCPPGLDLSEDVVQRELDKRRPQSTQVSTARLEEDRVELLSGIFNGRTTGAPIMMLVLNRDVDSKQYDEFRWKPRPGHADYPALIRYSGCNDYRGGGRFSGRLTAAFVMAGAVAKVYLNSKLVEVLAYTAEVAGIKAQVPNETTVIRERMAKNLMRCPDEDAAKRMEKAVAAARKEGDSVGGIVECLSLGMPPGVGNPIFDSLDADLAKMLFNIPAVKGVEFGTGFRVAELKGSENNDPYTIRDGRIVSTTNNAGGILGGLTNGMPIVVRVAFKATPSISKRQQTVNLKNMTETDLEIKGKHDTCIVPRAVPVVEASVAVVLADHLLQLGF
ncbi:chorismate synthase [Candidatus Bathyarchaeota archaeon]|nr:chorismate synthase [Candidatus Bathyarchaeota archaeon]